MTSVFVITPGDVVVGFVFAAFLACFGYLVVCGVLRDMWRKRP